jgi:gliding motility-associated-like protein
MKNRIIILIVLIVIGHRVTAQPPETTYLGNLVTNGYLNNIPLASDGPFPIGFNFTFYGNTYSQFWVSANGLLMFVDPAGNYSTESSIPNIALPDNFIAPFWDDLAIDGSGKILYTTIGAAPNRKLVVQYMNMEFYPFPVFFGTFSVILYENSNIIQIQFRQIVDNSSTKAHGESATIGIENLDGSAGVQYAYHDSTAITPEQAISFTPSGPTYTINSNAVYDGVYLTINLNLPEPGITSLITPPQDAVIGSDYTFKWGLSSNAQNYSLKISNYPDLQDATSYNAGTNLSYDITGLLLDTTYYWGVFASNATGLTWCEIQRFTTSSVPPLAPVPQTIWTEQLMDKTINLQYTGGDTSPKTAIITFLPAQGQLYQYNAGVRGTLISSVPATVTDAAMNVIYAATGSSGNGVGNFKFKLDDTGGDSPEGTVTINVSPPGVPHVLYVAKSTNVEIQFDIVMADPTGKQNQFGVKVNATPVTINSASLKPGDPYTIILTLASPLTGSETVLVSYTQGDIAGGTGGFLFSFTDQAVTLIAQTISFPQSLVKKFSDSPFTLTATASSGLGMTYSSSNLGVATASGNVLTFHALGTSDITARQAGNITYAPAKYTKTLSVAIGDQVITFNTLPVKIYGDADFSPGATVNSGLTISYTSDNPAVATIVSGKIHVVSPGTTVITASQGGNSLWNPAISVPQTLTVSKANQTITFNALSSKTYGDADFSPGASASSGLTVTYASGNPAVATIIGGMIHIVGAGSAIISASQAGDANYNAAPDVPQTLTVNKANQTITFGALSAKTYGDGDTAPGATASSGLTVSYSSGSIGVATIVSSMIHITGAGTSVITASQAGNTNYNPATDVLQTFIVNKANLTFTADNKTKVFQQPNPALTYTVSGFVNGENQLVLDVLPSIQTTALPDSPVDDYPITVSGGNDNCYNYVFIPGTLTITRMLQTIAFTDIPVKLLEGDSYTLAATSTSGLTVLFESMDNQLATVSGDQLTGISKGKVRIRAYHPGDISYEPAEVFDTVEIYSTHKDIMNLFTPNNDGFNDLWELPQLNTWGKSDVRVFNRWGKLVFASPDYHNEWDGTSDGKPVPEGPYYFVIKTENAGTVTGTVNIVR